MANQGHLEILKRGVEAWNEWIGRNLEVEPDLSGTDLSMANLHKAYLIGANLSRANLSRADLSGVDLSGANLSGANLSEAYLIGANLSRANLFGANLFGANLFGANLRLADFSQANLRQATLISAILVETNFKNANLTECHIYGISAWNLKVNKATMQSSLIITKHDEPVITVDNLKVAQFIYLLLTNPEVREVMDSITSKVVLILGRFTLERKTILDAIREELRQHNYIPVLFDFDKPATRDTHETITTLARLARFVIADITSPKSIPQELVSIVETMPSLPIQPLLKRGARPWGMYDHIKQYPWVLEIHRYRDLNDLLGSLKERVIAPAEKKVAELRPK